MKIFCIGFQRTGTTSLHEFFIKNNLKSTHDPDWWYKKNIEYLNSFDCFTDGFERYTNEVVFPDLNFLETNFKDCKFILQTRSLRNWLISRLRHGDDVYKNGINTDNFDDKVFLTWVSDRNYWLTLVYKYFENKDNLLILDIEQDNIEEKIYKFLDIQSNIKYPHENKKLNYKNNNEEKEILQKIDKFLCNYINDGEYESTDIIKYKYHK